MRYEDFEALVRRLEREVPGEFFAGVAGVEVSRKTIPHPGRADVYTLGECIPLPSEGATESSGVQSRVVLYHGSFQALSALDEAFDWRAEAWETLTHELRHHLEWRARAADLEAFDWAAEQNFARAEGEPFDPDFHRAADLVAERVYRLDDDFFVEQEVDGVPADVVVEWHGARYTVAPPPETRLPAFLTLRGIASPPPGALVLVLRKPSRWWRLRRQSPPFQGEVVARPVQVVNGLSCASREFPKPPRGTR